MAWVRLDDQAPRNHKVLKAGPAAAWMWVCGIAYAQSHITEGFIPDVAIGQIGILGAIRARKLAEVLVNCGLFDRVSGGYMVHDYLDFNETKEEAIARKLALSAKRAESGRKGGLAKVANSKQTLVAKPSPDPTRPDLKKERTAAAPRLVRRDIRDNKSCDHEPRCATRHACIEKTLGREVAH